MSPVPGFSLREYQLPAITAEGSFHAGSDLMMGTGFVSCGLGQRQEMSSGLRKEGGKRQFFPSGGGQFQSWRRSLSEAADGQA